MSYLDLEHPITVGSYMNEPDLIGNRYQLHLAMEEADRKLPEFFETYGKMSIRMFISCTLVRSTYIGRRKRSGRMVWKNLPDIFGICYFIWLVLIILTVILLIWLLRRKKRKEDQKSGKKEP